MIITASVLLVHFFCQITETVMSDSPNLQSDDKDFASSSGDLNEDEDKVICCAYGNYTFSSVADILNNISSNNKIINIFNDVLLTSNVILEGLENITIKGHRDPVVNCNDVGSIKFTSCKNVHFEGIQWERCGYKNYQGIGFYNSSNISFERCSFHNSKRRSISFSEVSGNVYINSCNFMHKNNYTGHGSAIYYLPKANSSRFLVQNNKFIFNRATQSVVYIDGSESRIPVHAYLQDNVFVNNTGVPVYVSHANLHIRGSVLFKGNKAKFGGGIYSNNSTVIFYDNSNVSFISNTATANGGAIYLIYSKILIYCKIIFETNKIVDVVYFPMVGGGAISCDNSNITFDNNSTVTFNNNGAISGGAVYCVHLSHITFNGNSSVTFNKNNAIHGGAVFCLFSSNIRFDGNSSVKFNNNEANNGGAISCWSSSLISSSGNSIVTFNNNNNAAHEGGAVYCLHSSNIRFDGNSIVTLMPIIMEEL